jgi:D-amino peptidase
MKVYISFDMEGTTGTAYWAQMGPDPESPDAFKRAQRLATDDVKAAIEGVLTMDPEAEIWFNDGHRRSMNVYFEEFPENVSIVVGSGELMDEVLGIDDSFDALICIGAHGNVLTKDAVLCHVWQVREVAFNGKSLSEAGLNASLAGYYGVPLVALSGDEATMKFIQSNISPEIATAVVKKGIGRYSALCLNPKKTRKMIKGAVVEGLKKRKDIPPLTYEKPITVEIEHQNQFRAHTNIFYMPEDRRISATRTSFTAKDAKEAYYGFFARNRIASERHNIR